MALRFTCPNCRGALEIPDEAAGTTGTCRLCGAAIVAPSAPGQPATPAAPGGAAQPTAAAAAAVPYGKIEPFGILSESWNILWSNFGPIAFATYLPLAIVFILFTVVIVPLGFATMASPNEAPPWLNLVFLALYIALSPLVAGPLYVVDDILTTGQAEMSAAFRGFQRYGAFIVFCLIYILLPNLVVLVLAYALRGLGWTGAVLTQVANIALALFMLTTIYPGIMEIVDRGADGISAVKASWEFTRDHRWLILWTWIVVGFAALAGVVALCVGVLVTALLWSPATVLIYRDIRGLRGGAAGLVTGSGGAGASARSSAPWGLVTLAGCGVLVIPFFAAILFPVFAKARDRAAQAVCLSNMHANAEALIQYAGEHGGRLPAAARWEDDIRSYLVDGTDGCPKERSGSGYVLNAALAGRPLPKGTAATTVLLFDGGSGGRNQAGNWAVAKGRHGHFVTVAYANGSDSSVPRDAIARLRWATAP